MSSSEVEASGRKVTNAELLDLRERVWSPNLRGASLVAELNVKDEHTAQVAQALGVLYARAEGFRAHRIFERWPACAALAVTGIAGRDYAHGTFWPAVWKATRYPGDQQDQ